MNYYCPITYEIINTDQHYSRRGLKLLSPTLTHLNRLAIDANQQRQEAISRIGKMSIQGIQAKLSAVLNLRETCFEIVDQYGQYILKPQSNHYQELPENEAVTMTMASKIGLEVPLHGLLYSIDNSMTYFIKRFDRVGKAKKIAVEDFAQLSQYSPETKYNSSMEKVIKLIYQYCTFPHIEALKLFKLILFNYLTGNEDMHLKNFSLITRNNLTALSPCYDLLNTTIAQKNVKEEIALPLNGKKNNLSKKDLLIYLPEKLNLNKKSVESVLLKFKQTIPEWFCFINTSFLSNDMKTQYYNLLQNRCQRLELIHIKK